MDYEKKYKEALEKAMKLYERGTITESLSYLFPELKESKDERIRKALLRFHKSTIDIDGIKGGDILAWLEKQGNNLVKNGYTKNKDYIRYADRYSYEIWRKLMDNFKNIKDYHIGCNEVSDIVLNAIIDTFNWLEKGGDKNKVSKHVEAINEEKVDDANKVEPKDYSSIDPHFFKTTDKVEPKFHEGEWITDGNSVLHITNMDYGFYQFEDSYDAISIIDEKFHLWNIRDAKDGDVLVSRSTFIYGKQCPYGGLNWCNNKFIKASNFIFTDSPVHPATKEQRDFLFQKMKEAGYEWDAEKKELKKISNSLKECEIEHIEHGKYYYCIKDYYAGGCKRASKGEVVQALRGMNMMALGAKANEYFIPVKRIVDVKPAWSEEDEWKFSDILALLRGGENCHYNTPDLFDWLKCLKDRIQPQQEWSVEDKSKVQRICKYLDEAKKYYADIIEVRECMDWLKSLQQRIGE